MTATGTTPRSPAVGPPRCRRHPAAPAGWQCEKCESPLCADCAALLRTAALTRFGCCLCGGAARTMTVHRSARPFAGRALRALAYPLRGKGLAALVLLSAILALVSFVGQFLPLLSIVGRAVVLCWYGFALVVSTLGQAAAGRGQLLAAGDSFARLAGKAAAATLPVWLPGMVHALIAMDLFGRGPDLALTDPAMGLFALLAFVYVPMALMVAATDPDLVEVLSPFRIFDYMRRIGRDYWIALAALAVLLPLSFALAAAAGRLRAALDVPLLGRWGAEMLALYVPIVMARIVGLVLFVHGDALDYGLPDDYGDPVLPGVDPRGTPPESAVPPRIGQRKYRPLSSIEEEDEDEEEEDEDHATASARPPDGRAVELAERITACLAGDRREEAIGLYATIDSWGTALTADDHFEIGVAAARERNFGVAMRALTLAADSKQPVASRALVALAQVYGDGLADAAGAARLYRRALAEFPGTDAAALAEQKIGPPAGRR